MKAVDKIRDYCNNILNSISRRDLKIIFVYYLCSLLVVFFAEDFNFIIGFFSFYICALLLSPQQKIFLKPITISALMHWPVFFILITFYSLLRQGLSPVNFLFLVFGFLGLILSLQIAVAGLSMLYLFYSKLNSLNEALLKTYQGFAQTFFKTFIFFFVATTILVFLNLNLELVVLFFYPLWFIFLRQQSYIKSIYLSL